MWELVAAIDLHRSVGPPALQRADRRGAESPATRFETKPTQNEWPTSPLRNVPGVILMRHRHALYLSEAMTQRLQLVAEVHRLSKSEILERALRHYLTSKTTIRRTI